MRLEDLKIKLSLAIPFGHPDKNGVMYSKEAIEKAIAGFEKQLPIVCRGNEESAKEVVVGCTRGDTYSVLWDDECQVCKVIINGVVLYGGTECIVNEITDGVVTDFDIVALGVSQ